jgi:hypothetical protein
MQKNANSNMMSIASSIYKHHDSEAGVAKVRPVDQFAGSYERDRQRADLRDLAINEQHISQQKYRF